MQCTVDDITGHRNYSVSLSNDRFNGWLLYDHFKITKIKTEPGAACGKYLVPELQNVVYLY